MARWRGFKKRRAPGSPAPHSQTELKKINTSPFYTYVTGAILPDSAMFLIICLPSV